MVTVSKKQFKELKGSSDLKDCVIKEVLNSYNDYDDIESYFDDLFQGGCQSGFVSGLIYYVDTLKFYKKHKEEINELLTESMDSTGCSMSELFGDKFDNNDPLVMDTNNMNLLAWFAFEETARNLANELGLEV